MFITVQTNPETARDLGRGSVLPATRRLQEMLRELDVTLEPMHPGAGADLATYFYLTVPDNAKADAVTRRLRDSGTVEAVYLKPPDSAP